MKPSSAMKKVRTQSKEFSQPESASEFFDNQKSAINAIRNTQGFQEIVNYRTRAYDESASALEKEDLEKLGKVATLRAEMRNARRFLLFLDNILE